MNILCIIPARYGSTRFPGKPLVNLAGKSMIQRVYEQAKKCTLLSKVVVATDHPLILAEVKKFGGEVCLTSDQHTNGTERCYEALQLQNDTYDYVINIQGDEPFITPQQITTLAELLDGNVAIATLFKKIGDEAALFSPHVVKTIWDQNQYAIYFSREPIPHVRGLEKSQWLQTQDFHKHIGMYAYRTDTLQKIIRLPQGTLEKAESLEQLRWLENGLKIKMAETHTESIGIDTPEDVAKAVEFLEKQN